LGLALYRRLKNVMTNKEKIFNGLDTLRALAITLARHTIHAMQKEIEVLKSGRVKYANDPFGLIAAGHVVAVEFSTIAAANNYWR